MINLMDKCPNFMSTHGTHVLVGTYNKEKALGEGLLQAL